MAAFEKASVIQSSVSQLYNASCLTPDNQMITSCENRV